jgi:hypothetical protein
MIIKIQTPQNNSYLIRMYECSQFTYELGQNGTIMMALFTLDSEFRNREFIPCLNVDVPYDIYIIEKGRTIDHLFRYNHEADTNILKHN